MWPRHRLQYQPSYQIIRNAAKTQHMTLLCQSHACHGGHEVLSRTGHSDHSMDVEVPLPLKDLGFAMPSVWPSLVSSAMATTSKLGGQYTSSTPNMSLKCSIRYMQPKLALISPRNLWKRNIFWGQLQLPSLSPILGSKKVIYPAGTRWGEVIFETSESSSQGWSYLPGQNFHL